MNLSKEFWDSRYKTKKFRWDIGEISAPLQHYFDQLTDKNSKILIPGGGNSYEAEYLHNNGFQNVYVVDISEIALSNLKKRVPTFPINQLLHQDFFELNDTFDLIIEQTFFCALNPTLRTSYAEKMSQLLRKNGKLVGLLFNDALYDDRPPFGGSKKEYVTYFKALFALKVFDNCYNSIASRKDRELFINLVKK